METHIPEQAFKVDWERVDQLRQDEPVIRAKRSSFLSFKLSLGFSMMLIFALGLFAILYQPNESEIPLGEALFYEQKDVLSVSFVSTASLIPAFDQQLSIPQIRLMTIDQTPIDRIKPYLGMIENLLAQDQGFSTTVVPSDIDDYETKLTIVTYDLLGAPITYVFYYNVDSYEKDGDEEIFSIRGMMMFHHVAYQMIGEKSIEDNESKLKVKGFIDELNYIESIYQTEDEESSYEVNRVINGTLVSSSKIKIEFDDANEVTIEVEIDSIDEISTYEIEYELEDGQPTIKVEYEVFDRVNQIEYQAEMRVRVKVDNLTGVTSYSILILDEDEEFEYESDRDVKTDNDDDDDDEEDEDNHDEMDEDEETDDEEDEDDPLDEE